MMTCEKSTFLKNQIVQTKIDDDEYITKQITEEEWYLEIGKEFGNLISLHVVSVDEMIAMCEVLCDFVDKTRLTDIEDYFFVGKNRDFPRLPFMLKLFKLPDMVKRGKWIIKDDIYPVCSVCEEPSDYYCDGTHKQSLYCPNCGAKMDGGGE